MTIQESLERENYGRPRPRANTDGSADKTANTDGSADKTEVERDGITTGENVADPDRAG